MSSKDITEENISFPRFGLQIMLGTISQASSGLYLFINMSGSFNEDLVVHVSLENLHVLLSGLEILNLKKNYLNKLMLM